MACEQDQIVLNLLRSYEEVGGINRIDGINLPSKRAIPVICTDLLELLFPGFLDEEAPKSSEVETLTRDRVSRVMERLETEVARSIRCQKSETGPDACMAHEIVVRFMGRLPEVRAVLRTDVVAAYEGDPAAMCYEEIILAYPAMEAIAIQRVAHLLYGEKVPILPRMMTEWAHMRTGIDIHPGAVIGSHFFIDHGTGVVIGETCHIGDHVKLYHGVTLGARSFAKDDQGHVIKGTKRHPNVEDGVTIYPNATVLGGDTTIGEGSTIGGNVFLMHSVPPFSLVAIEDPDHKILDKRAHKPAKATA